MTIGTIVDSDSLTNVIADQTRAQLTDFALTVRLFNESISPTPSTPLSAFTAVEAVFDTYAPLPIAAAWQPVLQIASGLWATVNGPFSWPAPLTTPDSIFGMWIGDNLGNWYLAYEFPSPIPVSIGGSPLTFNVQHNQWSRSILPGPF